MTLRRSTQPSCSVLTMALILATPGCVTIHVTNVDTTAQAYLLGEKSQFSNGEDFIEVTVGASDSADGSAASTQGQPVKVVYHLSQGLAEAQLALDKILSHLVADPTAKIIVVANDQGIEFLLDGAKDGAGKLFMTAVHDIKAKGVEFRLCNDTLIKRNIDPSRVIAEAKIVPSGLAEVARLQSNEGFGYLRP